MRRLYRHVFLLMALMPVVELSAQRYDIEQEFLCWTFNQIDSAIIRYVQTAPSSSQRRILYYANASGNNVDVSAGGTFRFTEACCCGSSSSSGGNPVTSFDVEQDSIMVISLEDGTTFRDTIGYPTFTGSGVDLDSLVLFRIFNDSILEFQLLSGVIYRDTLDLGLRVVNVSNGLTNVSSDPDSIHVIISGSLDRNTEIEGGNTYDWGIINLDTAYWEAIQFQFTKRITGNNYILNLIAAGGDIGLSFSSAGIDYWGIGLESNTGNFTFDHLPTAIQYLELDQNDQEVQPFGLYGFPNLAPSANLADTSLLVWLGNGIDTDPRWWTIDTLRQFFQSSNVTNITQGVYSNADTITEISHNYNISDPAYVNQGFIPLTVDSNFNFTPASTIGNGDSLKIVYLIEVLDNDRYVISWGGLLEYAHNLALRRTYYLQDGSGTIDTVSDPDYNDVIAFPSSVGKVWLHEQRPFSGQGQSSGGTQLALSANNGTYDANGSEAIFEVRLGGPLIETTTVTAGQNSFDLLGVDDYVFLWDSVSIFGVGDLPGFFMGRQNNVLDYHGIMAYTSGTDHITAIGSADGANFTGVRVTQPNGVDDELVLIGDESGARLEFRNTTDYIHAPLLAASPSDTSFIVTMNGQDSLVELSLTWLRTQFTGGGSGDNWGSQTAVTDGTTIIGNGTPGTPLGLAFTFLASNGLNDFDIGPDYDFELGGNLERDTRVSGTAGTPYDMDWFDLGLFTINPTDTFYVGGPYPSTVDDFGGDGGDSPRANILKSTHEFRVEAGSESSNPTARIRMEAKSTGVPVGDYYFDINPSGSVGLDLSAFNTNIQIRLGDRINITDSSLPTYADQADAVSNGLITGDLYTVAMDAPSLNTIYVICQVK